MDDIAAGRASLPSSSEEDDEEESSSDEEEVPVSTHQKRKRTAESPKQGKATTAKGKGKAKPETPAKKAKQAQVQTPKKTPKKAAAVTTAQKTPKKAESAQQTPKKAQTPQRETVVVRKKLGQGLECDVLRVGNGKEAKRGMKVTCSYAGKLRKGGKQFDQSNSFSFRLGVGEVIKGWDAGIAGMRVGEKRRLYVPSHLGYGKRGAGRDIPPNSALVCVTELMLRDVAVVCVCVCVCVWVVLLPCYLREKSWCGVCSFCLGLLRPGSFL
jgi:FK506-binding nuclear protein